MDDLFGEIKLRKRFITATQRQQVGKALREAGFGRDDFDWEERRSGGEKTEFIVLAIVHMPHLRRRCERTGSRSVQRAAPPSSPPLVRAKRSRSDHLLLIANGKDARLLLSRHVAHEAVTRLSDRPSFGIAR